MPKAPGGAKPPEEAAWKANACHVRLAAFGVCLGFRVLWFRVLYFGFRVLGLGFRVGVMLG